jgi:hypothetical protein
MVDRLEVAEESCHLMYFIVLIHHGALSQARLASRSSFRIAKVVLNYGSARRKVRINIPKVHVFDDLAL